MGLMCLTLTLTLIGRVLGQGVGATSCIASSSAACWRRDEGEGEGEGEGKGEVECWG